jgi:restriction endonuclease S subunit
MNVYDSEFNLKGLAFIDEEQAKKLNNVTVEENDILFNITGASVARCCIAPNEYLPARVNQHVAIIRLKSGILAKYVQKVLVSEKSKKVLLHDASGASTREAITKTMLEEFKIPLPTLLEQQTIVTQIEALEAKITQAQMVIDGSKARKEAVLKSYL